MPADDLKKRLVPRAAVIQRALRTRGVGDKKLVDLLTEPKWRSVLYNELNKEYEAFEKAAAETQGDASTGPASSQTKNEARTVPPLPETAPVPFTDVTDEPTSWWNPRQLLMQYTIATRLDYNRIGAPDEEIAVHEQILGIYDAFGLELLADWQLCGRSAGYSLLESLKATKKIDAERIGRLSGFQELFRLLSTTAEDGRGTILMRLVGDVDGIVALLAKEPPDESVRWLAELRKRLDECRTKTVLSVVAMMKEQDLVAAQIAASAKPARSARATKEGTPPDPLDWLFDFDLLQQIADAATHVHPLNGGPQPDREGEPRVGGVSKFDPISLGDFRQEVTPTRRPASATEDHEAAETIMQSQRRLVADATKILGDDDKILDAIKILADAAKNPADAAKILNDAAKNSADAAKNPADAAKILNDAATFLNGAAKILAGADKILADTDKIRDNAKKILADPVRAESLAEELWWRSLQMNGWNATEIATFCLGSERAIWLTSETPDPLKSRVQQAYVGSGLKQTPGRASNQTPGRASNQTPGQASNQTPGQASNQTASNQTPGQGSNQTPAQASNRPSVVIFGAGVAGLTAAHELAERGIKVTVVDAAMPPPPKPPAKPPGRSPAKSPTKPPDESSAKSPASPDASPAKSADEPPGKSPDKSADEPPKEPPEMLSNVGGMARTQWAHASAWPQRDWSESGPASDLLFPGEHGYRLFPSFYRHVFDSMKRTPILGVKLDVARLDKESLKVEVSPEQLGIRPTAFDQLQATHKQVFARRGHFVPLRRDRTRSLEAFRTEYMNLHEGLGFSKRDMARFFFKLLRYLMTCSERRAAEYETKSLMAFFDPSLYSDGFIKAIQSAPQALVAMDAELCDARTQGNVYIQLLLDQVLGSEYTDSTLRGPTSVAWFAHWYRYLDSLDVDFVNAELLALRPARVCTGARASTPFEVVFKTAPAAEDSDLKDKIESARYILVALDAVSAERVTRTWESAGVPFELRGYASHVIEKLRAHLARYDVVITFKPSRSRAEAEDVMHRLLDRISVAKDDRTSPSRERSAFRNLYRATGQVPIPPGDVDEIQIVLWFEHAAGKGELRAIERALARLLGCDGSEDVRLLSHQPTWVNTATTITTPRMSDDVFGEHTTDRFQTFIGVQYYFEHDFKLVRGHVYLPDTEWGLSAVSQGQFWPQSSLPDAGKIRGILSIDIGNCHRKSSYTHRTVMECTREEIAKEVWRQFTDSLRSTRGAISIVTSLPLPEPTWYHVDDNLVFTRDRGALRSNRTPFLVNNAGDWERRPRCQPWVPGRPIVVDAERTDATDVWQAPHGGYRIHADKVVFCGTYMRTFTRMTTMEAANESARHAVNAILDHMAAQPTRCHYQPIAGDYCDIWDPEEHELEDLEFFKRIDKLLFEAGKPHIADILQFDKIADLQHPDPSPIQALVAALGSTIKSDWGMTSTELVTGLNGLMQTAKQVVGGVAGAASEHPVLKLLGMLGIGKGAPPNKGS